MENPWASKVKNPWLENAKASIAEATTDKPSSNNPWASTVVNPWLPKGASAPPPKETTPVGEGMFDQVFNRLVGAESAGRHTNKSGGLLTSPAGARGITQLMPGTARDPGYGIDPVQDESEGEYLRVGRSYLQAMLKIFNGDYHKALAAYNAGEKNVNNAVRRARESGDEGGWKNFLPKKSETVPYIDKIMKGLE